MKTVKAPTSDRWQDALIKSLKNTEEAAGYIQAILEVEYPEPELLCAALQDVIEARIQNNNFSEEAKHYWEKLERRLSESGGAEIYALVALLDALGFRLEVAVVRGDR